ncbi:Protein ABHD8 [Taenia solium]|eukprot:TsM_001133300 transcript=TsM_001133300 gene=TsM_001133300
MALEETNTYGAINRKGLEAFCAFDEHFKDVQEVFDEYVVKYYAVKKSLDNEALKEQKPPVTTVVAHSYGTSLAVRLVESRSEAVQRLVLISGGAPIPLEHEWSIFDVNPVCLSLLTPCIRLGFQRQDWLDWLEKDAQLTVLQSVVMMTNIKNNSSLIRVKTGLLKAKYLEQIKL